VIIGHDGAGLLDEFGPDSMWAYFNDNPEDDEWVDEFEQGNDGSGQDAKDSQ
jgi:hypothetical protein